MNRYIWRVALAIVLALSTSPAQAGLNQWTTNGPNDAAIINSIAVDPNNPLTVYAASSKTTPLDGKVFKSTNGGGSWTPMTTGLPGISVDIIVVDPSNSNTLYAGTFGSPGVLKSTNGGGNWQPMNTGLVVQSVLALVVTCGPLPPAVPPLVAAVLPSSRSVQVDTPATAFVTLINSGTSTAVAPWIAPPRGFPAGFSFQTTNPSTNQPIGTPNPGRYSGRTVADLCDLPFPDDGHSADRGGVPLPG